ncbi:hypothetical protein V1523DRAFT_429097 [Lipomyces doorenjongii]
MQSKRPRLQDSGRKLWLRELRGICDRRSESAGLDGLCLLRRFIRDVMDLSSPFCLFPTSPMCCRHSYDRFLPDGLDPCLVAGVKDAGKASAFVKHDLKVKLREWLDGKHYGADENSDWDSEIDGYCPSSQSFDADNYPSSLPDGKSRLSTKARVIVLSYLFRYSDDDSSFKRAYKELEQSGLELLHLCGCGICSSSQRGCVTPSHLMLGSRLLNEDHKSVHFVLRLATSADEYRNLHKSISALQDGPNGRVSGCF